MTGFSRLARPTLLGIGALAASLAFAVLAALVASGELDAVDRFAVDHLMPNRSAYHSRISLLASALSYRGHNFHAGGVIRLPASLLLSTLLIATTSAYLWRRGRSREATMWATVFVAALLVEELCKLTITRPALFRDFRGEPVHLTGFDSSFPSGHAVRALVLAAAVASIWRRLGPLLAVWLVAVALTLSVDGIHTPSDIVGGFLLAAALVAIGKLLHGQQVESSKIRPTHRSVFDEC